MSGLVRSALFAAALGLGLGCGVENAPNSTRRGDLRVELPESPEPVRQGAFDFGPVPVGTSKRVTLRLINVGIDRAIVTHTRFEDAPTGAFFVQAPDAVAAGEEADLVVTFSPPGPNPYAGRLVIEHDGNSGSVAVDLTGSGG